MRISIPIVEQETVIVFPNPRVDPNAFVRTSYLPMMKRLRKLATAHPEEVSLVRDEQKSVECYVPAVWLKFTPPRHLTLTDEQRRQRAECIRSVRARKGVSA